MSNLLTYTDGLQTQRLRLRQWQESDYAAFADLNADPDTMRYFPATLSVSQSDALAASLQALIAQRGWGMWVAEQKETGRFLGIVGLNKPTAALSFTPCTEVAWRFSKTAWGQGFATEGARAALRFAFDQLCLSEIVSFTSIQNTRSERVMQRLNMLRDERTFQHPALPEGHPLREHCLYRLARSVEPLS